MCRRWREQGLQGFEIELWFGLLAPAGTPPEIVARYNGVANEILAMPKVRDGLQKQGLSTRGGPPEQLAQLIAREQVRWAKVVRGGGHRARVRRSAYSTLQGLALTVHVLDLAVPLQLTCLSSAFVQKRYCQP